MNKYRAVKTGLQDRGSQLSFFDIAAADSAYSNYLGKGHRITVSVKYETNGIPYIDVSA